MLRRHPSRRLALLVVLGLSALLSTASASRPPALPGDLPPGERARLAPVAEDPTVATRVEAEPFPSRRAVFEFLLDHPVLATHVTRMLKLARYRVWRTPDGLYLDDGWGAVGRFWVVYAGEGTRVMYARGEYRKRLFPDIPGRAIVRIDYEFERAPDGRSQVVTALAGFVKIDNDLVSMATRVVGALARRKAELEARRLVKVFRRVSRAIEEDPAGIYRRLRQRPGVPQTELAEFGRVLNVR